MLAIAGGVIIGFLGLWAILALIGTIAENGEEIAQGCAFILGLLVIIGFGVWLDSEWPEIDWMKTAVAALGILFAIGVAIGHFYDSPLGEKLRSKKTKPKGTKSPTAKVAVQPKLSEEEAFSLKATEIKSRWEKEGRRQQSIQDAEIKPIKSKIEKAKALVESSGVGSSICIILKTTWNWPSSSKQYKWKPPIKIKLLDGGDFPDGKHPAKNGKWLELLWKEHSIRLELIENRDFDYGSTGVLQLIFDGSLVLELGVSPVDRGEYSVSGDWRYHSVNAFVAGTWMAQINDIAGQLEIARMDEWYKREKGFLEEKSDQIELP